MLGYHINQKCMLKYDPEDRDYCNGGEACSKCGWNVDVHNARVRTINENGLTTCEDGLKRLIIK